MINKIAAVTEDGVQISNHFGMAPAYRVFTVEAGQIVGEEERAKPFHAQHPEAGHSHSTNHSDMFAPIGDCQVLLCGGMGTPAYQKALAVGLEVVLTAGPAREVVQAYLDGRAASDSQRIHQK
jgi:predicted Fe-Mo cluster-binding NifX family protein